MKCNSFVQKFAVRRRQHTTVGTCNVHGLSIKYKTLSSEQSKTLVFSFLLAFYLIFFFFAITIYQHLI